MAHLQKPCMCHMLGIDIHTHHISWINHSSACVRVCAFICNMRIVRIVNIKYASFIAAFFFPLLWLLVLLFSFCFRYCEINKNSTIALVFCLSWSSHHISYTNVVHINSKSCEINIERIKIAVWLWACKKHLERLRATCNDEICTMSMCLSMCMWTFAPISHTSEEKVN